MRSGVASGEVGARLLCSWMAWCTGGGYEAAALLGPLAI